MRLAYFPNQIALNAQPVLDALLQSCRRRGWSLLEDSLDADVAVIWSVLWNGRMAKNKDIYHHYRTQGLPVICMDVGTLIREQTWKVAVNNINAQGFYGHRENLDFDRPRKLGLKLKQSNSSGAILIAAQHQRSLQVEHMGQSMEQWIADQIQQIKQFTDRPCVVRPHPRSRLNLSKFPNVTIQQPQRLVNTYDSYNIDFDYHAVVNYNSGPGIQAAIQGVRPVVDSTSLAYPVSVNYQDIEQPYTLDRQQWFVEICHTEYTLTEIAQGSWIDRLQTAL